MESNLVLPTDACPSCGERDVDRLIWDDETVTCTTCGIVYDPNERKKGKLIWTGQQQQ